MKKLLCLMVVVAFAGTAYAANDTAPGASHPPTVTRDLTEMGYFPLDQSVYCVGLGVDGEYIWVSHGDQGGTPCMFLLFDEYGNLVDQAAQGGGATGWGARDMCFDGMYMFNSFSTRINGFTDIYTFAGYFNGPLNPNRAMAFDGTYFYTSGFGEQVWRLTWDGTFGSSAYPEVIGGPYGTAAYGLAYDCGQDCLWQTTSTSAGDGVYQIAMDGTQLNHFMDPNHIQYGGCEMMDTAQFGTVLAALVQETPDGVVFYDVGTSPSPTREGSWGEIKGLFR